MYNIKRDKTGGIVLECKMCSRIERVNEFDDRRGSRRTQAALCLATEPRMPSYLTASFLLEFGRRNPFRTPSWGWLGGAGGRFWQQGTPATLTRPVIYAA
jgi:hypothetical protein